ncbi:glycoside hydrolase family 15 protein [Agromyces sp. SYSU T00266]|uniref:glycoside hydrolase family 15 protein n=1 Tax=Agromyces zhanjiangensis TaxID=3158562 RepID=UPI003390F045
MSDLPIGQHALLSDRHSAAVVTSDGCVAWLCLPRFDSESVFASILDDDGGHWWIRPTEPASVERAYVDGSMVLRSTYRTGSGSVELVEALELPAPADPHRIGVDAPHTLLRVLRCTGGSIDLELEFRPRPGYGTVVPHLDPVPGGLVATGGAETLTLSSTVPCVIAGGTATARFRMHDGDEIALAMQFQEAGRPSSPPYSAGRIITAIDTTVAAWRDWSDLHQTYQGPWRDLVHHSGRVLKALSYQPTGAIVAAATTSLPEVVGGARNWDYRYSWVRDASFTMQALWVAACPHEANDFFGFIASAGAAALPEGHLQIMYGVGGERDLTERTVPHWAGWRGSAPVRIGNGAWNQPQLDVYGELLDAATILADQLAPFPPDLRDFLASLADAAAVHWNEPDHGIWEIRGAPRHYLFSKLMCWVALDRAAALADRLGLRDRVDGWRGTADRIRDAILADGWNPRVGAFTQSFGSDHLDASALMIPLVGLLPPDDPRVRSTVDAITAHLIDDHGLVRRYLAGPEVDRLPGTEGSFLLCTFWLARVLADDDRVPEARAAFERAIAHINDVGLLAEEVDSGTGEQLGNFPQAFSHVGLVNAAWAISLAEERAATRPASDGMPRHARRWRRV